jgi:hypothetical protein
MVDRPEMQSKDKLAEAAYFLEALSKNAPRTDEFNYNLSAFLGATQSVVDVMLYDFVEKFDLGFNRDDKVTPRDFFVASKAKGSAGALEFLDWWRRKVGGLEASPLWDTRHFIVHRGYPKMETKVEMFIPINVSGTRVDEWTLEFISAGYPPPVKRFRSVVPPGRPPPRQVGKKGIFLVGGPDADIRILCRELFAKVGEVVAEAEKSFSK